MNRLAQKKLFLLDMDGTIYHENTLIPGALDFFKLLQKKNKHYVFFTNNSSKGKSAYVKKLNALDISATERNIISSVDATILYLRKKKDHAKIYLVGTKSLQEEIESAGYTVVPIEYRGLDVDYVLIGFDTELNYKKIEGACYYINREVEYLATNIDLRCPIRDDKYIPDCGAICKMIELAVEKKPVFLGKPNREIIDVAATLFGIERYEDILCIGDRLYTDIACGINAGIETAVVLTGETKKNDLMNTQYVPTYCFESIKNLYEILKIAKHVL